ncbi:MAG: cell envelope biogenesis protein OmpA [Candidatus Adiutrix sp.]|jgi:membrane associated rhomboid family serine protease|nr:cell envelope biogenesis protein OmpA [Candidatus Adiutrix sp.]
MKNKLMATALVAALALGPMACTNMTKTEQGATSGAVGGALIGATIGAIAGGRSGAAAGAAIGGAVGGVGGAIAGNTQEQYDRGYTPKTETDPAYKESGYRAPAD